MAADIVIKGAREHNLRDVDLSLPRNRLICLTGVSGSGKSSLAFDTLYAEGQRRYVESLSSFARQFLGQMPKPDVDYISGLSPSISISQKSSGQNPRSTVGTITEIYDYLRVLFARTGQGHCPQCSRPITAQTREQIIDRIDRLSEGTRFVVMAPLIKAQKGEYRDLFVDLLKQGFARARVDGTIVSLDDNLQLDRQMRHTIEVVIDRLTAGQSRARLAEAVELALKMGQGSLIVSVDDGSAAVSTKSRTAPSNTSPRRKRGKPSPDAGDEQSATSIPSSDLILSAHYACTHCGISFEPPSPQLFSFNSPQGMCTTCDGLGELYSFDPQLLVPDDSLSFKAGCFELIGAWRDMGRWRRHIYHGVADSVEHQHDLPTGTMLDTPWRELDPQLQELWLSGTGDLHVTYTWRQGTSGHKYGGRFEGIIPLLLDKHRNSQSKMQLRQLEKYMHVMPCADCGRQRLNPQARAVTLTTVHPSFADRPRRSLPEVCALPVSDAIEFFSELDQDATRAAHCRRSAQGSSRPAGLSEQRGARVSDARPHRAHALRRRVAADSPGRPDWLRTGRACSTFSTSPRSACTHATTIACSTRWPSCATWATPWSWSSTTKTRCARPTTSSTSALDPACAAERSWPWVRPRQSPANRAALPAATSRATRSIPVPAAPRPSATSALHSRRPAQQPEERRCRDSAGRCVCITGVSGSGKSSLVSDILVEALRRDLNGGEGEPGTHDAIEGLEHLDKLIAIDQSPIGRTPRSNPATYIKLFDEIRDLYTKLTESKTARLQGRAIQLQRVGRTL